MNRHWLLIVLVICLGACKSKEDKSDKFKKEIDLESTQQEWKFKKDSVIQVHGDSAHLARLEWLYFVRNVKFENIKLTPLYKTKGNNYLFYSSKKKPDAVKMLTQINQPIGRNSTAYMNIDTTDARIYNDKYIMDNIRYYIKNENHIKIASGGNALDSLDAHYSSIVKEKQNTLDEYYKKLYER